MKSICSSYRVNIHDETMNIYYLLLFEKKEEEEEFHLVHHRLKRFFFSGPQKFLPPLVYHWRLGRCLAALQTILGVAITVLSLWLLLWAPHLPITDNPYWSGMPVSISITTIFQFYS